MFNTKNQGSKMFLLIILLDECLPFLISLISTQTMRWTKNKALLTVTDQSFVNNFIERQINSTACLPGSLKNLLILFAE